MSTKRYLLLSFIILSLVLSACGSLGGPKPVKVAFSLPPGTEYWQKQA